jgi:hypothetical protein
MSNTDDYNAKLETLKAMPDTQAQQPIMPVDAYLQEAENLCKWALDDQKELKTVGVTLEMINDLPVRAGALREIQSLWNKDRYSQEEAQRQWALSSPLAYELRDELLHHFRFAYRADETLLGRVSAIAEGNTHADMIQDLNDLAVLGRANLAPLKAIAFDTKKLDTAATLADEMADLLARSNGDRAEQSENKVLRDKAYTHLKELVDTVREAGKYVFWKNPQRLKGYVSQFWKNKNSRKGKNDTEDSTSED